MSKRKNVSKHAIESRRILRLIQMFKMAVGYRYSDNAMCRIVHDKTGDEIFVPAEIIQSMGKRRYKWSVLIAVLCIDETGKQYMKSEAVIANEPYTQPELADYLHDRHKRLIDSTNPNHLRDVAWLASPIGTQWDEEEAFNIFQHMGDWVDVDVRAA